MLSDFKCPYKSCGGHFGFTKERGAHTIVTCPHCGRSVDIGTKRKENVTVGRKNASNKKPSKSGNGKMQRTNPKSSRTTTG